MDKKIFLAKGAHVTGQVSLGNQVGIWYNAVVRGDCDSIQIGNGSNVQDNVTIHTDKDYPVRIGEYVSIGHNAVVHGCTIGDNTVIGMGAVKRSSDRQKLYYWCRCFGHTGNAYSG